MQGCFYEVPCDPSGSPAPPSTALPLVRDAFCRAGYSLQTIPDAIAGQPALTAGDLATDAHETLGDSLLDLVRADPALRPQFWVTGGLAPNATDRVGPRVCRELQIPYLVVEPREDDAADAESQQTFAESLRSATLVLTTRSRSAATLARMLDDPSRLVRMLPFADLAPGLSASNFRDLHRNALARQYGFLADTACLVTSGSPASAAGLTDWRMLALALSRLVMLDWHLFVVRGDPIGAVIRAEFRMLPHNRIHFCDNASPDHYWRAISGSDLYVWPATGGGGLESLLRAQATGTPVVACETPDAADRVLNGQSGRLAAANAESLSNGISFLLRHSEFRNQYGRQAREIVAAQHDLRPAAEALRGILSRVMPAA